MMPVKLEVDPRTSQALFIFQAADQRGQLRERGWLIGLAASLVVNLKAVICPEHHDLTADAGEFQMALGEYNSPRSIHLDPLCLTEH